MSVPPWYRERKWYVAETLPTLDISNSTGIGPLKSGLSLMWDMTPLLCLSDPRLRVRVTVDADAQRLRISRRGKQIAMVPLMWDRKRIGAPLRAICRCGRFCYRMFLCGSKLYCGKCLRVTYRSGQRGELDRIHSRIARLEQRREGTEYLPRHRGRRKIIEQIRFQRRQLVASFPASLARRFGYKN